MTKAIKDAESWVESLEFAMNGLGKYITDNDVFTSYDLGVLYDLQNRLLNRYDEKTSLLAKLKREEEISNVDG